MRRFSLLAVAVVALLTACGKSDKELCEDVQKKFAECGGNTVECPDNLADSVREQYECIVDKECNEIADCAD